MKREKTSLPHGGSEQGIRIQRHTRIVNCKRFSIIIAPHIEGCTFFISLFVFSLLEEGNVAMFVCHVIYHPGCDCDARSRLPTRLVLFTFTLSG